MIYKKNIVKKSDVIVYNSFIQYNNIIRFVHFNFLNMLLLEGRTKPYI